MRRKIFRMGISGRLIIALILALCLVLVSSNSAVALGPSDYFSFSSTVEFSKTQVTGSEVFSVTIEATANVTSDLPVSPSEAEMTGRIIATHQTSGANVTLNSGYTLIINDFPSKEGDSTTVSKVVSLQFPGGSQSGTYNVVTELIEARIEIVIFGFPVWVPVTDYVPESSLPPPQTVGSVTYTASTGGGGGGGGGGGTANVRLTGLTSETTLQVDEEGILQDISQLKTPDEKVSLNIARRTKLLDAQGKYLDSLSASESTAPPDPPAQGAIVSAYDFGPDGATFDPPMTLTITYDESLITDDVSEENLVMAMWDETIGEWVVLAGSTVDPGNNTVTAPVSHFTTFAAIAYTDPVVFVVKGTAAFGVGKLAITPAEVGIGEEVTISTLITNTGDIAGSYKVTLMVDNEVAATEEVTLAGGAWEKVIFTMAKDVAGSYAVAVDGQSGTFVVKGTAAFGFSELAITPAEVGIGEEVTISTLITNTGDVAGSYKVTLKIDNEVAANEEVTLAGGASEEVTFTMAKDVAGSYAVAVDGLSGIFVVRVLSPEPEPGNWWLRGGIIAVGIALAVAIYLIVIRRRIA